MAKVDSDGEECKKTTRCEVCYASNSDESDEECDEINLTEWLTVSRGCCKCWKTCCRACIGICYSCANNGDYCHAYCKDCKPFAKVDCKYHRWQVCEKHVKDECGECHANRNYCLKYGFS